MKIPMEAVGFLVDEASWGISPLTEHDEAQG